MLQKIPGSRPPRISGEAQGSLVDRGEAKRPLPPVLSESYRSLAPDPSLA